MVIIEHISENIAVILTTVEIAVLLIIVALGIIIKRINKHIQKMEEHMFQSMHNERYNSNINNNSKYPHFDEAAYLKKAKIQDSGHFETFRSDLPENAFSLASSIPILGIIIGIYVLVLTPFIAMASHMYQISYRRNLAYKIYLEECECIKLNKTKEETYFDTTKFSHYSSRK